MQIVFNYIYIITFNSPGLDTINAQFLVDAAASGCTCGTDAWRL
jgi:hypothetical protein